MNKIFAVLAAMSGVLMLLDTSPARAENKQFTKVMEAAVVLNEIMAIPEQEIPPVLLRSAHGIAVIPGLLKAGFFVGARYGTGVLVVHKADGGWSNPVFVTLTGGSFGFQIGAQATDVILVFKTSRSIDAITQGKFTLGADASLSAGPVGRHAEADTDIMFGSEIYSYARSRGLFVGVALEGAAIQIDYYANSVFYNTAGLLPTQILSGSGVEAPYPAEDLRRVLARYANQPDQSSRPGGINQPGQANPPARPSQSNELNQPNQPGQWNQVGPPGQINESDLPNRSGQPNQSGESNEPDQSNEPGDSNE